MGKRETHVDAGHLLLINFKVKLLKEQNKQEQDECVKFTVNVREGEMDENVEVSPLSSFLSPP